MKFACIILSVPIVVAAVQQTVAPANAPSRIVVAPPTEPGTRMRISGVVVAANGEAPLVGASVYVYQTDARGYYNPRDARDSDNPRLKGYLRTDASGAFSYETVRPGSYPGVPNPGHVHYHVSAPGYRERVFEVVFEGDTLIPAEWRRQAAQPDAFVAIVSARAGPSGVLVASHRIVLQPIGR